MPQNADALAAMAREVDRLAGVIVKAGRQRG